MILEQLPSTPEAVIPTPVTPSEMPLFPTFSEPLRRLVDPRL